MCLGTTKVNNSTITSNSNKPLKNTGLPCDKTKPDTYTWTIRRQWQTDNSTISTYKLVNDCTGKLEKEGYFLERPGPDTITPNQSLRVPAGEFQIEWYRPYNQKLTKPGYNVPRLFNSQVSKDRKILMHIGNYPRNSEGCLLFGDSKGVDFVGGSISTHKDVIDFLKEKGGGAGINGNLIDKVKVIIINDFKE